MTEYEYQIEMLCCLPKQLLINKLNNVDSIPKWLKLIDEQTINEALCLYETGKYRNKREEMIKTL